jgi:hypothetical protein
LVDDEDEEEEGEYASDSEMEGDEEDDDGEDEGECEEDDNEDDGDQKDGEIVEVFPDGRAVERRRLESVSHDEVEDPMPVSVPQEEDDSRYAAMSTSRRAKNGKNGRSKGRTTPGDGDIIEIDSSDSSIVAIKSPAFSTVSGKTRMAEQAGTSVRGTDGRRKRMGARERREFWAAKGRVEEDREEVEHGGDFAGLD